MANDLAWHITYLTRNATAKSNMYTKSTENKSVLFAFQNELLEVEHGERLDISATGTTGGADPEMATLGAKHRTAKR